MSGWIGSLFLCVSFGLASIACSGPTAPDQFRVGMTQEELLAVHGNPERTQTLRKQGGGVFGPIEDFWSSVPMGSSVEIWMYPVEGGTMELYFVDDSERVQGTGFAPSGAVFESR